MYQFTHKFEPINTRMLNDFEENIWFEVTDRGNFYTVTELKDGYVELRMYGETTDDMLYAAYVAGQAVFDLRSDITAGGDFEVNEITEEQFQLDRAADALKGLRVEDPTRSEKYDIN